MAISEMISQFAGAVDETRAQLGQAGVRIEQLENERAAILRAPPHSSDIVAAFRRWLEGTERDFERQLTEHLAHVYVRSPDAAKAVTQAPFNLLKLEPPLDPTAQRQRADGRNPAELNLVVLVYLLRDRIAEELPGWIDKLCPQARAGLKAADRKAQLQEIDAKLAEARAEFARLEADLEAARQATWGNVQ